MTKTYCGKECSECIDKETLGCTGCTDEKKQIQNKDCKIVNCCLKKGHEECNTCGFREKCTILAKRETMSADRIAQREQEKSRKVNAVRKAPLIAKWMNVLFLLSCSTIILRLIVQYGLNNKFAADIFNYAVTGTYSIILLQMASEEDRYRNACYYGLAAAVSGIALTFSGLPENELFYMLALVNAVVGFVSQFYEFMGHSNVVKDASTEMSAKWQNLWKWYIGTLAVLAGSIIGAVILPLIGALAMLGAAIALIIVLILQIIYLYETAEIFRKIIMRNSVE